MAQHTSKFQAFTHAKCPKCRVGQMFVGYTYSLKKNRYNDLCPHCGFRFEVEPGYFYAAMYVSYALVVAQMIGIALLTYLITRSESPWTYLIAVSAGIILFAPFNFRYSRLILLHYMTPKAKYDPKYELMLADEDKKNKPVKKDSPYP